MVDFVRTDFLRALGLLTIIPAWREDDGRALGRSFACYPLVGGLIGLLLALGSLLPLPPALWAFLLLLAWVGITGGLHLDGLGDACDGLLATVAPARRLEIMKDPRTGTWAVLGIVLLLLGKFATLSTLYGNGAAAATLIAAPVAGRWAMVFAAQRFAPVRPGGMGALFREGLGQREVAIATLTTVLVVAGAAWSAPQILLMLIAAPLIVLVAGGWAARRLGGGLTGDVYGALCEVMELVCLLGVALWAVD
jgi:adenosylcobinamide-GDP ribazoletransferase